MESATNNNQVMQLRSAHHIESEIELLEVVNSEVTDQTEIDSEVVLAAPIAASARVYEPKPFIEAKTKSVSLSNLKDDCIVPVFAKDNERTIAHHEFIEQVKEAVSLAFPLHAATDPEIKVSHLIKGRIPAAMNKRVSDLVPGDETYYYERMAFIIKIPSIVHSIQGHDHILTIGGVRGLNQENLYSKKSLEKFKFFIGFKNMVCCNLCVSTDGFLEDLRVGSANEIKEKTLDVMKKYDAEKHISEMKSFTDYNLTEQQFAQLIGKTRLYQHLPKDEKLKVPVLNFNDSQINTIARDYYEDSAFSRSESGDINLYDVYNLFTQANKTSYIDTFLDRGLGAFEFTQGIQKALEGESEYHWFLS